MFDEIQMKSIFDICKIKNANPVYKLVMKQLSFNEALNELKLLSKFKLNV